MRRTWLAAALLLATAACRSSAPPAEAGKTLRVIPPSDLEILDPVWTTAAVTRDHGYMIYDTLFGTDSAGRVSPQMVDTWTVSPDRLTWTFTLRDGLAFHDGAPVTSADVIASIERWGRRDTLGQKLAAFVDHWEATSAATFRLILKEPYGMVLESLGKPDGTVPFVMPKRVADTPADTQISDYTGSGPFVFQKAQWRPGERVVYTRNSGYKPRSEPPSGTAGGKVVKVDRVVLTIVKDPQTQASALSAGEVDLIEQPAFELYPTLQANSAVHLIDAAPAGHQFVLRFNHRNPPFDHVQVRLAATAALNQPAFLDTQIGVAGLSRPCFSVYPCSTAYASQAGMDAIAKPDPARAQQLLKASGYAGTPIVILRATDQAILSKLPVVAAQLLKQAGFAVDLQSMDWQTLVTRRAKPAGWHVFFTNSSAGLVMNPIANSFMNASCDTAWFGWPCDPELEQLRSDFARAETDAARMSAAQRMQVRAMAIATHVPLGEYVQKVAARPAVTGMVTGYFPVLWNVDKD